MIRRAFAIALITALGGCGDVELVNPAPTPTAPGAGPSDAGPSDAAAPPDQPAPKRTVEQRNPFGNVAETENLLWDGDFEWHSPFSDEYGWLSGPPYSYNFPNVRVGAECRSGLKCALVKKNKGIIGIGVSSQGNKLHASFWVHLAEGTCDQVVANVADMFDMVEPDAPVKPVSTTPDPTGWCHFDTIVDGREHKAFLFILNKTKGDVIVDDAVLKKSPNTKSLTVAAEPPTGEMAAVMEAAREDVKKLRGPHDAPPNEAKKALQKWRQR